MIIVRSPLRITLGGGGTDLPSYYRDHEGFLIAAAIDKYVYVTVIGRSSPASILKYSRAGARRDRSTRSSTDHPRGAATAGIEAPQIEITTLADIPAGTGWAPPAASPPRCSRRCTPSTQLIHPAGTRRAGLPHRDRPAGEPIGKQDQYIAAYGGITCFTFHKDGTVDAEPLNVSQDTLSISRTTAALLHRLFAQRRKHPRGPGHTHQAAATRR